MHNFDRNILSIKIVLKVHLAEESRKTFLSHNTILSEM